MDSANFTPLLVKMNFPFFSLNSSCCSATAKFNARFNDGSNLIIGKSPPFFISSNLLKRFGFFKAQLNIVILVTMPFAYSMKGKV